VPSAPAAKITIAPGQPDAAPPARPRAARSAPNRPGATAPLAEGIAPNPSGQIVPVNATLSSAHQALEKGQLDEAERLYRQTLANDPRSIDAMLGLAAALTPQNKADAAAQYYVRVLEQDPRNAYAQAGLLNLTGRADPVAAEARLKQLIARDPSAFLYFSLGNLYAEHGQWAPAQAAYFQAHSLSPDNPDYAFNLAVGLEHLSQPKIALNYYRRALSLAQSRGNAQFDAAAVQSRIRTLETNLAERP
jgi:tetratricopeptide (TPR) repeat protein